MFLGNVPAVAYSDPWKLDFAHRLANLQPNTRRLAYFYREPDSSTFRYRVYNMIQALGSEGDLSAAYFCDDDLDNTNLIVDHADVLVLCRTLYDQRVNALVTKAKARGKKVLFDVDDLVFDVAYTHQVVDTLAQDTADPYVWEHWFGYMGRLGATLRMCDGALTTNTFLADRIREFAGIPVAVVPNFLNQEQLSISNRVLAAKRASGYRRDGRVHIGYFSGTPTHDKDFALIAPALQALLETDPRVVLVIAGYMKMAGTLQGFSDRVEIQPMQDFLNLQRLIGRIEINVVPLQMNTFTNCKSELKYFEAAAVGTISIASPTFTYRRAIKDSDNGYLARAHEWLAKLTTAIECNEYETMAERAASHALTDFGWQMQGKAIGMALDEIVEGL